MILPVLGALLIGVSLGLLGSGGSILTVPVLAYGLGHNERVAIAESLVIVGAIAAIASLPYIRSERVCWRSVFLFGLPGMVGTYTGAALAGYVSGTVQLTVFGTVMLLAAGLMLRPRREHAEVHEPRDHPGLLIALEGIGVGVLTGFVGVGGGFLIVPALVLLRGLPIHYAVGTSLLVIAMKSGTGFVKYLDVLDSEGLSINWVTVAIFVVLGAVGTLLGTRMNRRFDQRKLAVVFASFLIVVGIFIVAREGMQLYDSASAQPLPTGVLLTTQTRP